MKGQCSSPCTDDDDIENVTHAGGDWTGGYQSVYVIGHQAERGRVRRREITNRRECQMSGSLVAREHQPLKAKHRRHWKRRQAVVRHPRAMKISMEKRTTSRTTSTNYPGTWLALSRTQRTSLKKISGKEAKTGMWYDPRLQPPAPRNPVHSSTDSPGYLQTRRVHYHARAISTPFTATIRSGSRAYRLPCRRSFLCFLGFPAQNNDVLARL